MAGYITLRGLAIAVKCMLLPGSCLSVPTLGSGLPEVLDLQADHCLMKEPAGLVPLLDRLVIRPGPIICT